VDVHKKLKTSDCYYVLKFKNGIILLLMKLQRQKYEFIQEISQIMVNTVQFKNW